MLWDHSADVRPALNSARSASHPTPSRRRPHHNRGRSGGEYPAEVAAAEALLADAVAEFAALVADVAAALAEAVAEAESTNKSHLAISALELKGVVPEDVCAVLAI